MYFGLNTTRMYSSVSAPEYVYPNGQINTDISNQYIIYTREFGTTNNIQTMVVCIIKGVLLLCDCTKNKERKYNLF